MKTATKVIGGIALIALMVWCAAIGKHEVNNALDTELNLSHTADTLKADTVQEIIKYDGDVAGHILVK